MLNSCIDCGNHYEGLGWFIPDEAWLKIKSSISVGELCPWCANARLSALELHVRAYLHLDLSHFHGYSQDVIREHEALVHRMHAEQRSST